MCCVPVMEEPPQKRVERRIRERAGCYLQTFNQELKDEEKKGAHYWTLYIFNGAIESIKIKRFCSVFLKDNSFMFSLSPIFYFTCSIIITIYENSLAIHVLQRLRDSIRTIWNHANDVISFLFVRTSLMRV